MELMKGELNGKMIKKFVALRPKIYSYMTDDGYVHKAAKGTKKCNKTKFSLKVVKSVWKIMRKC